MKKTVFIIIIFFLLEIIMTYPLVFKAMDHIPGFFSTDESYVVPWNAWFNKFSLQHNLSVKKTDFIAYPFGINFFSNRPIGYLWFAINYALSILTTPTLTYNVQVIINFFLAFLFVFFLVYKLTKSRLAGFVSGITFAFCPFLFVRAWQHLGDTYCWVIPMVLLSLVLLKDNPSLKKRILIYLSLIFMTLSFNFYYCGIASVVYFIYVLINYFKGAFIKAQEGRRYIKNIFIYGIIFFVILLPRGYFAIQGAKAARNVSASALNPYHRPFEDLIMQSARPLSYILPASVHPVFGGFTEQFVGSELYGKSFTEHTLYLGWIPLILAFFALRKWRKQKQEVAEGERFYIGYFLALMIVAWLFSQPPWWAIGPLKIAMPSFFMYKVLPMFRAYCRFGMIVMVAVSVLAGFGVKLFLERLKTRKSKFAVTVLFCSLVLFEFWNYPPYKLIDVSRVPSVYYWLKEQPESVVIAEYPLDENAPNEMYRFYQAIHEKKMINYTIPETYANKVARTIIRLSAPGSAATLRWMGVKYALVHRDEYLKTELTEDKEELNKIFSNPGLKFIKDFPAENCPQQNIRCVRETGPIDVYEVVALPNEPKIK